MKGKYGRLARQASANRCKVVMHLMRVQSMCGTMLYGSEIWGSEAMKIRPKRKLSIHRIILLKVAKDSSTVSHDAIRALLGAIPLDLLNEEKKGEDREASLDSTESKHTKQQDT